MAFVNGIVYKIISPGQTLTIWGGFLDGSCSVYFGEKKASVVDYDEDRIEVLVPLENGDYKVTLKDGANKIFEVGNVSVVELADTPKRNVPKEYEKKDFFNYVLSLLPRGNAFSIWKGSSFNKLLTALADAFKYTWETILAMVDSVDPTHTENFGDWENELNLPVLGIFPDTFEGRRAEIYRVECTEGGCSKSFIKKMLFLMGIDADVYEYNIEPVKFVGVDFGEDDPHYFVMILFHLKEKDFVQFHAGLSCAGDFLLDFKQYKEEKVFNDIKPSHTKIIFSYDDGVRQGYILKEDGGKILDSNNKPITYKEYLW